MVRIIVRPVKLLLCCLVSCTFIASAHAETAYVSDLILVNLRSERGGGKKIATLRSNDVLEILEKSGRYVRVKNQDGLEGWMQAQYVSPDPPKQVIVEGLKQEIKRLENNVIQMREKQGPLGEELVRLKEQHAEKVAGLSAVIQSLEEEKSVFSTQLIDVQSAYDDLTKKAAKAARIADQYDALTKGNSDLSARVAQLENENAGLRKRSSLLWFLAGGGVFFSGWVIGKISRRRHRGGLSI